MKTDFEIECQGEKTGVCSRTIFLLRELHPMIFYPVQTVATSLLLFPRADLVDRTPEEGEEEIRVLVYSFFKEFTGLEFIA